MLFILGVVETLLGVKRFHSIILQNFKPRAYIIQEICNYLQLIDTVWNRITCGDDAIASLVDEETVQLLESRAPMFSSLDYEETEKLFRSGRVFPKLTDSFTRSKVLQATLSVQGMIVTLRTFY